MRLGIVPYLNCLPLVYGLDCELFEAPPAQLTSLAKPHDIILAPIVAHFLDPQWQLVEASGIGSFGPVETVKLFFNKKGITCHNIKTIYTDTESLTSRTLLKILLAHHYRRDLQTIGFVSDRAHTEGELLIGDKVFNQPPDRPFVDLGEAWTDWTGLPFVFACWMTRNKTLGEVWQPKLAAQLQKNLTRLEEIADTITGACVAPSTPFGLCESPARRYASNYPKEKIVTYWRQLVFEMGPGQKEAIALFRKYFTG